LLIGRWESNRQRLDEKSRMSREAHVRFCESVGVKFPRATRPIELSNGQIVRFVGVNAPDSGQPFEEEATEAVIKLLQGKTAAFEYDFYTSDRFGRVLAYPFVDGKNVVVESAKQGLVKVTVYQDRRKLKYQDELLRAESIAKQKKLGIWSKQ